MCHLSCSKNAPALKYSTFLLDSTLREAKPKPNSGLEAEVELMKSVCMCWHEHIIDRSMTALCAVFGLWLVMSKPLQNCAQISLKFPVNEKRKTNQKY